MSKLFLLSLYHTSFAPLWISIIFIDVKSLVEKQSNIYTETISIICIVISCCIALFVLRGALCINSREGTSAYEVISAKEEKTITAEYLLSYILPLFAFDFTKWDQVVLFLIFYFILCFLCLRHNYFSINIILEVANYRFYSCSLKNEDNIVSEQKVISRHLLNGYIGESIYLKPLNNEYRLDIHSVEK